MERYLKVAGGLILLATFFSFAFFILSNKRTTVEINPSIESSKNSRLVSLSISDKRLLIRIKGKRIKSLFVPTIGNAEVSIKSRKGEVLLLRGTANKVLLKKEKLTFSNFNGEGCNGKIKIDAKKLILEKGSFFISGYHLKGDKVFIFGKRLMSIDFEKFCKSPEDWIKESFSHTSLKTKLKVEKLKQQ